MWTAVVNSFRGWWSTLQKREATTRWRLLLERAGGMAGKLRGRTRITGPHVYHQYTAIQVHPKNAQRRWQQGQSCGIKRCLLSIQNVEYKRKNSNPSRKNWRILGNLGEYWGVEIHSYRQMLSGNALEGHNEADLGGDPTWKEDRESISWESIRHDKDGA